MGTVTRRPQVICAAIAGERASPTAMQFSDSFAETMGVASQFVHVAADEHAPPDELARKIAAAVPTDAWLLIETSRANRWSAKASVAEHLIEAFAGVSIAIGPKSSRQDGPIVVALDGSQAAETAIPVADAIAEASGALLLLCGVVAEPLHAEPSLTLDDEDEPLASLHRAGGLVGRAAEIVTLASNDPVEAIAELAKERQSRFIVLASRGDRASKRSSMSRTTAGLMAEAPCPVVVVHAEVES